MLGLLELVPRWALLASAAAAVLAAGVLFARLERSQLELARLQATLAEERQAAADAGRLASERYREQEQRLAIANQEITNDTIVRTQDLARALPRAAAAGAGLRVRAEAAAARCGAAAGDPGVATLSASAPDAGQLLADVLGRLDEAGRQLAEIADSRGIAGADCQRRYEALSRPPG